MCVAGGAPLPQGTVPARGRRGGAGHSGAHLLEERAALRRLQQSTDASNQSSPGAEERRPEPWRPPPGASTERQANILHHKQSLSSGSLSFET
ncbi:jg19047 [Pararge aegeria aegeria]|uniref:Jg19047 protein n=1 Tax=Pararge aegeria aegeria TaxID=348720 RepID=A0A8S4QZD7_9NEOP|nr:jg19047 [Pararge aegeria aegeria]